MALITEESQKLISSLLKTTAGHKMVHNLATVSFIEQTYTRHHRTQMV